MRRRNHNYFRIGRACLALMLLVGIAGVLSNPFTTRAAEQARDDSTAQLRADAEAILRVQFDAEATARALKFLELTKRRIWGYHADNGEHRAYEGVYEAEVVRSNKPCLLFNSRNYVPISQLDAQAAADLAEIGKLRLALKQDYLNLNAELQRRQSAAIEAQRQAEMQRQAELDKLKTRRARLLVDTELQVIDAGSPRLLDLSAGEVFEVAGDSPTEYLLVIGGKPVPIDRRRCEELKPTVVLRPIAPGTPNFDGPAVDPPKLDCRIGSYQFPDGREALQIEAVALGGLADRYQIQVGEVLERVNDQAVGTLDDYRIASTRFGGGLKLVLFNPAAGRSRIVEIPPPNAAVPLGIFGRPDNRGEFVIDDVLDGSIAAQMGLNRNDRLLRVNDVPISTETQLRQAEAVSGGRFRLRVVVDGRPKSLVYP